MSQIRDLGNQVQGESFLDSLDFLVDQGYADIYTMTSVASAMHRVGGGNISKATLAKLATLSVACAITQIAVTILVFADTINDIADAFDVEFCDSDAFWTDRATAMMMCTYLFGFYIQKSWVLWRDTFKHIRFLHQKKRYLFCNDSVFIAGRAINLNSLVFTTVATVLVLYVVKGTVNLILYTFALTYVHALPGKLVDTITHKRVHEFLRQKKEEFRRGGEAGNLEENADKGISFGLSVFFFLLFGIPVIVGAVFALLITAVGIIILPICKLSIEIS